MELVLDLNKRYSYADYLTWFDDKRRELIDGLVHMLAAPKDKHAKISENIGWNLGNHIRSSGCGCEIRYAPYDVRFPGDDKSDDKIYTVVQPDICVICDKTKIDENGCIGAPDLIIEIVSGSTKKYDWNYKFNIYERYGVREYWIVEPKAKIINVFVLQQNNTYDSGTEYEYGQNIPVHIFNGFEIDTKEL